MKLIRFKCGTESWWQLSSILESTVIKGGIISSSFCFLIVNGPAYGICCVRRKNVCVCVCVCVCVRERERERDSKKWDGTLHVLNYTALVCSNPLWSYCRQYGDTCTSPKPSYLQCLYRKALLSFKETSCFVTMKRFWIIKKHTLLYTFFSEFLQFLQANLSTIACLRLAYHSSREPSCSLTFEVCNLESVLE